AGQPAAQDRAQRQPLADQGGDPLQIQRRRPGRVENADPADMRHHPRRLQCEEAGVQTAELLHGRYLTGPSPAGQPPREGRPEGPTPRGTAAAVQEHRARSRTVRAADVPARERWPSPSPARAGAGPIAQKPFGNSVEPKMIKAPTWPAARSIMRCCRVSERLHSVSGSARRDGRGWDEGQGARQLAGKSSGSTDVDGVLPPYRAASVIVQPTDGVNLSNFSSRLKVQSRAKTCRAWSQSCPVVT